MDADAPTPCAALTRQLLAAAPPNERLLLDLPACRVRIRGNDPGVMSALRAYYREHALASASGDADLEILALAGPTPALPWPLELRDRRAWRDAVALVALEGHQPFGMEPRQRLADRYQADTEATGELVDDDPLAFGQFAIGDQAQELLVGKIDEARPRWGDGGSGRNG